jgi:undecaprenyl-diphosphatase
MMTRDLHTALEARVFRAMNFDLGPAADALAVALSSRLTGLVVGLALGVALLVPRGRHPALAERIRFALALGLAVGLSDLIGAEVLKPLFGRMRPCYALEGVRWIAPAADVGAIPSLHAANFFAMAAVAFTADRALGLAALAVAAAVSWSRVYVGVHWPTDVLAGAAWGIACAAAALQLARGAVRRWRPGQAGGGE